MRRFQRYRFRIMDYLKIPRLLIYKDRNDLKDFGVQTPDTMNYLLFMYLKQQALMGVPGAREVALRCFNNAYYICTLILLEADDFPELRISDYVDKILEIEKGKGNVDEVCLASMAMACLLLAKYDEKRYGTDSEIWKKIYYRCTHYQWYHSSATGIFLNMMSWDYNITSSLSHIEFAPRDIIEAIEEASPLNLAIGHKYICNSLSNVTDRRKAIYGADLAISRLNDDLREIYEDWEYNPDTNSFEYEDDLIRDLDSEQRVRDSIEIRKSAVEYIIDHFPTKENITPQAISETQSENTNLCAEKEQLKASINSTTIGETTANVDNEKYNQLIIEKDNTINELQQKIADYASRFDPKDVKGKKVFAMTGKQHAILLLAVLAHHNRIPNARTNLSYLLSFIASRNESTMKDYLKERITPKECEELAKHFDDVAPFIGNLIRALPDKLEKDKSEKNRAKVLKK